MRARSIAGLAAYFAAAALVVPDARAGVLTVTNANDGGSGSLRSVVGHAKDGDTIVFDSSLAGQTITLTSGEIVIKNSIDIEGPGASSLAVSGNDTSRAFNLAEGIVVTMAGLVAGASTAGWND